MTSQPDYAHIAAALVSGTPLDFKAYPDGSLVVIAPTGQKLNFSSQEVNDVQASFTRKESSKASAGPKKPAKPSPLAEPAAKEPPKVAPLSGRPRKSPAG